MAVDVEKLYATDDAQIWAQAFVTEFGGRKDDIDEGLMIGWFANAIETARRLTLEDLTDGILAELGARR